MNASVGKSPQHLWSHPSEAATELNLSNGNKNRNRTSNDHSTIACHTFLPQSTLGIRGFVSHGWYFRIDCDQKPQRKASGTQDTHRQLILKKMSLFLLDCSQTLFFNTKKIKEKKSQAQSMRHAGIQFSCNSFSICTFSDWRKTIRN